MSETTMQFVTQMKLQELRRLRERLREAYQQLSAAVSQAEQPGERLRQLYTGLQPLRFAGHPLHPDVVNLGVLLFELEAGTLDPDLLQLWLGRLEAELAAGQARAEHVYLFGALLDEWSRTAAQVSPETAEKQSAHQRQLEAALTPAPSDLNFPAIIDPLFDRLGPSLADLQARLRAACAEALYAPVDALELSTVLMALEDDVYQSPALRQAAAQLQANTAQSKELADALTILIADLPAWDWPAAGFDTRAVWTRNKWRLFLDEDLPTACLLELVGQRWITVLEGLVGSHTARRERVARLKRLTELNAPAVILANERQRLLRAAELISLGALDVLDPWQPGATLSEEAEELSIVSQREAQQRNLRPLNPRGDYSDGYDSEVNRQVVLVNAEIQLARAAFPGQPLYVLKADVHDYYASLSHPLLLACLQRLGVSTTELEFFQRFLTPPVRVGATEPVRLRRGVPMNHRLSGMLAELVLRLLESHVTHQAHVRSIRLVDDVCLLTPDPAAAAARWQRLSEFCAACGLRLNAAKSGAWSSTGALPDGLPSQPPQWGLLALDDQGHWQVHVPAFNAHLEQSRRQVNTADTALSRVFLYNANVKYLLSALAMGADLGATHRAATTEAIRQFHQGFFGPGQGMLAGLRTQIAASLQREGTSPFSDAWCYWPITAGGLGLRNPLVTAGQYAEASRKRTPAAIPKERLPGWDTEDNDWGRYYAGLLETLKPDEPAPTPVMKALEADFIARGQALSSGQQHGLTPYWRWILYTYGPQLLQQLGTFHFLITELVPLQLIGQRRLQETSIG